MQVNIVMHSFNAIEARAKKAAQMRIEGNEYDPLFDPVAYHIFKKAYEKEAQMIEEIIEEELSYRINLTKKETMSNIDQTGAGTPSDANMPNTEICIHNLVDALIFHKGWTRSYTDVLIRDAIDRENLLDSAPVAWQVSFNGGKTWTIYEYEPTLYGEYDVRIKPLYTHPVEAHISELVAESTIRVCTNCLASLTR